MEETDYKKKYEEALKAARTQRETYLRLGNVSAAKVLAGVFPELNENKDEETRKAILEFFRLQDKNTTYSFVSRDDIIAWLENQNHDRKKWIYEDVYYKEKDEAFNDGMSEVLENPEKYGLIKRDKEKSNNEELSFSFDTEYNNFCRDNNIKTDDNSYKIARHFAHLQKPSWNEDDEKMFGGTIADIRYALSYDSLGDLALYEQHMDWLKSLKERCIAPKQETSKWNELTWQDINYLEDLMNKVHYEFRNGISAEGFGKEVLEKFMEHKESETEEISEKGFEPKFGVGDWVVYERNGDVYQIHSIDNSDSNYISYICKPLFNTNSDWPCFHEDRIHLWTIQDAKDGDVLFAKGRYFTEYAFIYSGRTEDDVLSTYCGFDIAHNNFDTKLTRFGRVEEFEIVCPATKEQRNLLFRKMKEAGYQWDNYTLKLLAVEKAPDTDLYTSNEQKAIELCGKNYKDCNEICVGCPKQDILAKLIQMADFKDKQFKEELDHAYHCADHVQYMNGWRDAVEKAEEWLQENAKGDVYVDDFDIEMFKKQMMEAQQ